MRLRPGRRAITAVGAVVFVLVLLLGLVTARLFVWPPSHLPRHADAAIVLSGDHGERIERALRLMKTGAASTLVFDGSLDTASAVELCRGGQPFEVVCLAPSPDDTRAEARAAARLAKARSWRTLIVVTTTHHATRAGLLLRRCFRGTVRMIPAEPAYGWTTSARQVAHEWLATAHALVLARGC